MQQKDLIRRIFNSLFIHKNAAGDYEHRMATVGISAKRNSVSTSTGDKFVEEIVIPKMPINPGHRLPLPEGHYTELNVLVFYNTEHVIKLEDFSLEGDITLHSLFESAKDLGKAFVVGKTYSDPKKTKEYGLPYYFDIDDQKISITRNGDAYEIKNDQDEFISTDSKIGKEAIRQYIRKQIT